MATLTICMPSNRPLYKAKRSIDFVHSLIVDTDIRFLISDNSADSEKRAYIQRVYGQRIDYVQGPPGAFDNWMNAVFSAKSDFVMVVSDDDIIVNFSGSAFNGLRDIHPDIVGFRPGIVVFNPGYGMVKVTSFGLVANTAKERVEEYFKKAQGMNSTLFSAWRKDVLDDIYNCFAVHPTRGEYADWSIVLAFASSGRIIEEKSVALFYDNERWSGNQESISRVISKLFTNAGLYAIDQKHLTLLLGIDSYILIRRKGSPLSEHEKIDAANLALAAYLKSYIKNSASSGFMGMERYLVQSLAHARGNANIFDAIRRILGYIGLAEKYAHFYQVVIGKPWGAL